MLQQMVGLLTTVFWRFKMYFNILDISYKYRSVYSSFTEYRMKEFEGFVVG